MGRYWHSVLAGLSILVALAQSAVVPTQDTMVVAASEKSDVAPKELLPEHSTEEPSLPIKLTEMEVRSEIAMRYAHTAVVTRVRNPAKRAQEATFRVLLPETAFISGFIMTLNDKPYKAYVKEKEEAKQIYNQAVSQGIGAAHISAKARDSNHFTVSVNVEPNTTAVFNLTYEELLVRRNGVYNHAINLHPGSLVPKLIVTVHIRETQKITDLRVPEIRTGNEIDATEEDKQNSKAIIERGHDDREATIIFKPDLDEQKRLIEIYTQKTKESQSQSHHHYWDQTENENVQPGGVLGQFVVQYDVNRPKDGEILVNDGYFVHFFAPSSLPPLKKHVVFVLDTSGSMMSRKIEQLKEAMQTILSDLNQGDYFSIVEFASSVKVHDLEEAKLEPPKNNENSYGLYLESEQVSPLVPPSQATPENIAKAKIIINRLQAGGGTNIAKALDVAVELVQKGIGWTQPLLNTTNATTTSNETPKVETDEKEFHVEDTSLNSTDIATLEPIIIFLTDGDPTVGETNPKLIINRLTEKNYGKNKATIFSLAFGEDADRSFLRKLSLRSDGFMRHIYEAADAALQLRDFYRQVSSPLLAHVNFVYPPEQVKVGTLTKHKFRTFYAGSEAVVAGYLTNPEAEIAPQVLAFCGVEDGLGRKKYEVSPGISVPRKNDKILPLERLWAYLTIKQLLDDKDAIDDSDKPKDSENASEKMSKRALKLALKYEFVTPLTSLVVVKPNDTSAVNAESVDKPQAEAGMYPAHLSRSSFLPTDAKILRLPPSRGRVLSKGFVKAPSFSYVLGGLAAQAGPPAAFPAYSRLQDRIYGAMPDNLVDIRTEGDGFQIFASNVAPIWAPASTTSAPSNVETYHLQEFSWIEPLIVSSNDSIVLQVNGTTVSLKLTRDNEPPRADGGDSACAGAAGGAAGMCVYLTRCEAARQLTVDKYAALYCSVDNGYAGVCCPKEKLIQTT